MNDDRQTTSESETARPWWVPVAFLAEVLSTNVDVAASLLRRCRLDVHEDGSGERFDLEALIQKRPALGYRVRRLLTRAKALARRAATEERLRNAIHVELVDVPTRDREARG